jgi:hypothetical protein
MNKMTALVAAEPEIREIKGAAAKRAVTAAAVLGATDEMKLWLKLLNHKDPSVQLRALTYLCDQRDGKARQRIEAAGENGGPIVFTLRRIEGKA